MKEDDIGRKYDRDEVRGEGESSSMVHGPHTLHNLLKTMDGRGQGVTDQFSKLTHDFDDIHRWKSCPTTPPAPFEPRSMRGVIFANVLVCLQDSMGI